MFSTTTMASSITVDFLGRSHVEPWGGDRHYTYGAPLDPRSLFGDGPETGLA